VIGQAVLGFVLPWILAMVAIPLETLVSTGNHVASQLAAGGLFLGSVFATLLRHLYDALIMLPLGIERLVRSRLPQPPVKATPGRRESLPHIVPSEVRR